MLELSATELIFDGDQAVGIKAVCYNGTTYEIYGDSIILATGGYIGDDSLVKEHFGTTLNTVAATINDGAGIKMGQSAGGAFDLNAIGTTNICSIQGYRYYVVYTQEQMDSYKENDLTENFATATSMFMGQGGEDTTCYAVIAAGYTYGTVGGLDVNVSINVLKADGSPIESLFAVGTDSMGVENIEGKPYTPWGGQAHSWTFVSGYMGGKAAAKYGTAK